jgi:flagellar motor switch protein FliG
MGITFTAASPVAPEVDAEVMSKVLAGGDRGRKSTLGGVKTAAEIINMMVTERSPIR